MDWRDVWNCSAQIESFPALQPHAPGQRHSPIRDVFLTNADLDHVLGLFLLREHTEKLRVHCTPAVRETLNEALRMETLLKAFCGIEWRELRSGLNEETSGLSYRAIPLPAQPPRYARKTVAVDQSVALEFIDPRSGTRLLVAPDVAEITPALQKVLQTADTICIRFHGTQRWYRHDYTSAELAVWTKRIRASKALRV